MRTCPVTGVPAKFCTCAQCQKPGDDWRRLPWFQVDSIRQQHAITVARGGHLTNADKERAVLLDHIAELEGGIRRVHEACKRGANTKDHGPRGNVACILDHLLDIPGAL